MPKAVPKPALAAVDRGHFHHLFDALKKKGYQIIGPTVRDGAIVYDELTDVSELPAGWQDAQAPGKYQLGRRPDAALFGYTVSPHSWKRYLHVPRATIWQGKRNGMETIETDRPSPKLAFIGVRACELAAIARQDDVLMRGPFAAPNYVARRRNILIVAVNCGAGGANCFCASTHTGPKAQGEFDLCLTELLENGRHRFLVETGSKRGQDILKDVPHEAATAEDLAAAERAFARAEQTLGRRVEINGLRELLYERVEHPRWDQVAERCLSCGNCTMVCPTCFCMTVEDTTDLTGDTATRTRRWDSCFTLDFSYIHGGSVRPSARARYRQWLTHKLAAWQDQFGVPGCTGCGRCITWCPVGIDITEEAAAIRNTAYTKEVPDGND